MPFLTLRPPAHTINCALSHRVTPVTRGLSSQENACKRQHTSAFLGLRTQRGKDSPRTEQALCLQYFRVEG